jgi:hypothetical protein
MALGSTQPLSEMSTWNLPGGKVRPARKADNLAVICEPTVQKMWEPRRLTTLWAFTACYRDSFTFDLFFRPGGAVCTATDVPTRHVNKNVPFKPGCFLENNLGWGGGQRVSKKVYSRHKIYKL